jgi:hypothetical protein
MIYSIFATKDTTIFENSSSMNTGIDEILEISKLISHSAVPYKNKVFNSRALLQFDIATLSQSIENGLIGTNDFKCYLNMYISEASNVPYSYGLEARPVSQSWEMGVGRLNHYPETTEGASWKFRDGSIGKSAWLSSSWAPNSSGSWTTSSYGQTLGSTPGTGQSGEATTIGGGGHWYTTSSADYYASQVFTNESVDVRMDVTNIVNKWISGSSFSGSISNDGFIIKRSGSEERDSKDRGSLKFFSRDTHTIYAPKLEICWKDSTFNTGSLSVLDTQNKDIIFYMNNNRGSYKENTRTRFRVYGREKYPPKTYATKSSDLNVKYLPSCSYYSIKDAHTKETVVPFSIPYTAISCDSTSNYFDLWMDGLQPERYYKFIFKTSSGSRMEYYDNDYLFKVVR